jgi:iron complex transport system ATP-binding protein
VSLACTSVSFRYSRRTGAAAVRDVSASVQERSICALVGRNGSGKSTLLRMVCGFERPSSGTVTWRGQPMSAMRESERARRCAFVPQRPFLSAAFSVRELVSLGTVAGQRGLHGVDGAIELMGLSPLADRLWHRTSEGERMRAVVARALVQCPEDGLLVLDEPFAPLDPGECARMMRMLRDARSRGVTVVCAVHQLGIASVLADCAWWLEEGQLLGCGPVAQVLEPSRLASVFGVPFEVHAGQIMPMLP